MKENISKEKFQKLGRAIAKLVKMRDPDILLGELQIEVSQHARFILEHYLVHKSSLCRVSDNATGQLERLGNSLGKIVDVINGLSNESRSQISIGYLLNDPLHPDSDGFERLCGLIYQAQEMIDYAKPRKKTKNRPKEDEKQEFLEAVVLVFEKAIGLQISEFDKLSVMESRKLKTGLYKFLEYAQFGTSWFQSQDAAKKMMDRYISDSRPFQDDVLMSYKNFIKDELNHM